MGELGIAGPPRQGKTLSKKVARINLACRRVRRTHRWSCCYQRVRAHEPPDAGGAEWASHRPSRV